MKISAQEEYGLRILLAIAQSADPAGLSIPQLSQSQGLSEHYVGKLSRILRLAGFLKSSRGKTGGYQLSRPAKQITLSEVLSALGGKLYDSEYCVHHAGQLDSCPNMRDCSMRSVWQDVQKAVDHTLGKLTLADLVRESGKKMRPETETTQ